jgi:uncharacterized membrane protein YagU involved in acid resistance
MIAAALDLGYAFVFYWLRGIPPQSILQSISSGLLGADAYRGGASSAALGAFLHFFIVIVACAVFHGVSRYWRWLIARPVLAGMAFGLCVYVVMNLVVVPMSAFPHPRQFDWLAVITGVFVHIFFVGVPIALSARASFVAQDRIARTVS